MLDYKPMLMIKLAISIKFGTVDLTIITNFIAI